MLVYFLCFALVLAIIFWLLMEIKSLQNVLQKHNLQDMGEEYLRYRICTRLYTCMRLYYFHDSNNKSIKEKIADVRKLANSEPYKKALATVNLGLLNTQEKIFVYCMKMKLYSVVYLLVKAKSESTKRKLN